MEDIIDVHESDDRIVLVMHGQTFGLIGFPDLGAFHTFLANCQGVYERCKRTAMAATQIPDAVLDAFEEDTYDNGAL